MMLENDLVSNDFKQYGQMIKGEERRVISLKDIADICGVSISTVSKALNNKADISKAKKEEIQKVAKELNYIPNYMASTLRSKRTRNIGVLLSENTRTNLMHEHFARILNSFKDTVEERGYIVTFLNSSHYSKRLSYIEQCRYMNFDGVFILCADYEQQEVDDLLSSDFPIVVIDHEVKRHINVASNQYGDMRRLMQFIYDRGHRRIAYIHGENEEVTKLRILAYQSFMKEHQLSVPKEYTYSCPYRDYEKSGSLTKAVLALSKPPTCIIYPDDLTAVGGMNIMQELGMRIPEDMSLAGYDGLNIVNIVRPRLTTIRQDTVSMGIQAGNRLINKIEFPGEETSAATVIVDGMVEPGETVTGLVRRKF
ncbi:MAG TPA: LacI family DNA-binding transcriptional regulator [Candidatus Merdenecus merdavium]|nr:LacI family DNA-binding transcriptional regulator [Candidatus Merdenecus merdavium]